MEIIEKPINEWKYNKKDIVVYETINDKNIQILDFNDSCSDGYLGLSEYCCKFIKIKPIYVYMNLNIAYKCIVKIDTLLYRFAKDTKPIEVVADFDKLGLKIDIDTQNYIKHQLNLD